jgi:hypothetical protein
MKCKCGRDGRYSHFKDNVETMSCNKHIICLTYSEQFDKIIELSNTALTYEVALRKIVDTNGMDYEYKTWAKTALGRIGDN